MSTDQAKDHYIEENQLKEKHLKHKFIQVDTSFLSNERFVDISLFDRATVRFYVKNFYKNDNDYWVWSGSSDDSKAGYANFIFKNGRFRGSISYNKEVYLIRSFPDRTHILHEALDTELDNECDTPLGNLEYEDSGGKPIDELENQEQANGINNARTSDACYSLFTFNVLFAYTPQFYNDNFSDREGLYLHLNEIIESLNITYTNSGQNLRARLVFAYQTPSSEAGNKDTDFDDWFVPNNDGHYDEVFDYREEYRADVCILLISANLGGRADRERKLGIYGFSGSGYPNGTIGGYGVAHEIGHMQNLEHNREEFNIFERAVLDGKRAYGKLGNNYRTVMSYTSSGGDEQRVPYFSGDYNGQRTFPDGESLGTDRAKAITYLYNNENRIQRIHWYGNETHNSQHLPLTETVSLNTGVRSYSIIAAKQSITLAPGFEVQSGSEFSALIRNCIHQNPDHIVRESFSYSEHKKSDDKDVIAEKFPWSDDIVIYPNPSSGAVAIKMSDHQSVPILIEVLDIGGHVLYSRRNAHISDGKIQLSFDSFANGVYLIKVTTRNEVFVSRFLIEK